MKEHIAERILREAAHVNMAGRPYISKGSEDLSPTEQRYLKHLLLLDEPTPDPDPDPDPEETMKPENRPYVYVLPEDSEIRERIASWLRATAADTTPEEQGARRVLLQLADAMDPPPAIVTDEMVEAFAKERYGICWSDPSALYTAREILEEVERVGLLRDDTDGDEFQRGYDAGRGEAEYLRSLEREGES